MIYMDNAATSFPKPPEVITAVNEALNAPASPGRSGHAASLAASRIVHKARKNMAKIFGIKDNSRLVFCANVTWALNIALEGFGLKTGDHLISGPLEHNAVARVLERMVREKGLIWDIARPDEQGLCSPGSFKDLLRPETRLAVLCHASNVTGALAPARAIKDVLGEIPLLLDTAQTAGAMDLSDLGSWVDMIAFTGHKGLLGPTGTGGLWVRPGLDLRPLAVGGTGSASESLEVPAFLPDALEPGTANTHGLAGLAAGAQVILDKGPENIRSHEMDLTMTFLTGLAGIDGLTVYGPKERELRVSTVAIAARGFSSSDFSAALEKEAGIMTRAGLHCAPLAHRTLGSFPGGLTRFSFGPYNTLEEIATSVGVIKRLMESR